MSLRKVKSANKKSLFLIVSSAIMLLVSLVFCINSAYFYQIQKEQLEVEIIGQASESAGRLSRILSPFLESYQIHEYQKLVQSELLTPNHYALSAILVDDFNMAKILGEAHYLTGRVAGGEGQSHVYTSDSSADKATLDNAYYVKATDIHASTGEVVGQLFVYVNDKILRSNIENLLLNTVAVTLALLVLLLITLYLLLKNIFIKPLNHFTQVIADRGEDGIPRATLTDSSYLEIDALVSTVRDMVNTITHTQGHLKQERLELENVINGTRTGTWYWNIPSGKTHFNERWANMLGYTVEELRPISIETWTRLLHPDDAKYSEQALNAYFRGETDFYECEARMRHKDGHWVWVLDRGQVFQWSDQGEPIDMFGTHQDITARKQSEVDLALAASVYEQLHEGILISNVEGKIIDVNEAFTRITGYSRDEVIGERPNLLKSGRHDRDFYDQLWQTLQIEGVWTGEIWNKRKNGDVYPELITISAVKNNVGELTHYVALFSDITSLKEHEYQLERIAHYDNLTGLPNRFLFRDRLRVAMSQAKNRNEKLALLFLDLDGFKEVNDSYGHTVGDRLLVELAQRISTVLREEDTVARIGGDEFILILPNVMQDNSLEGMLDTLLDTIALPAELDGQSVAVTSSIGVAVYPEDEDVDADQLIRQADQAMYAAKLAGKNIFRFFDPAHDRSIRGFHENIACLSEALTEHEFELYYQPKVNLASREVVGFEALIRWNHPEKGVLTPGHFLPDIEGNMLMVEIGAWTIRQSLMQLEHWQRSGLYAPISVNISAIHLQQKNFMDALEAILLDFPSVEPKYLEFEVLETSAIENIEQVQLIIRHCNDLGIGFAIDDFGTGYASLSYLRNIPAKTIKIDQSFVKNMGDESEDRLILVGVIGLAKAFRKSIIAEGLEDMQYANLLLELGCECAQGYGIAYPMRAEDIPAWTEEWRSEALLAHGYFN
ncbi:putative bifunctional diguanylate cyclase/phosphodiesterase [Marinomonas fungiae]|uniref:PAS domain S-box/diguanylate cyclase (GGDEF) domain n=1 Tax=Marinomonas fungiae TaxID=1137284 RepID=A0A0K6IMC2_9GAMM|nr:EAL domain-containing protein [Marinomonas fungiae]CUB04243.1 PAS domain S-box/diguanylate cyclase (GGDEF) domain [Marinomonas fungiae]